MKPCPFCGAQVPEDAVRCMYCGNMLVIASPPMPPAQRPSALNPLPGEPGYVKNKNWTTMQVVGALGLVFLVFVVSGAIVGLKPGDGGNAVKVDAQGLVDAYERNVVAADETYRDKLVLVTGTVDSISKTAITNSICVTLSASRDVLTYPTDDQAPAVAQMSKGSTVTMLCTGGGKSLGSPVLQKCTVK